MACFSSERTVQSHFRQLTGATAVLSAWALQAVTSD